MSGRGDQVGGAAGPDRTGGAFVDARDRVQPACSQEGPGSARHSVAAPQESGRPTRRPHVIGIIGGGFTGAALACRLLEALGQDRAARIHLIERGRELGRGVAYATRRPEHTLNVPASRMSFDPASPDAFLDFARRHIPSAGPHTLLPRHLYGVYMQERLDRAIGASRHRLQIHHHEATDARPGEDGWDIFLSSDEVLTCRDLVLATGHGAPRMPAELEPISRDPRCIRNPWDGAWLDALRGDEPILIVGTGLSAVDVAVSLIERGHAGPLIATSRSGRWPATHTAEADWPSPVDLPIPTAAPIQLDALGGALRRGLVEARRRGAPWQGVVDALRRATPGLWSGLSPADQALFLRRHRAWWERLAHRVATTNHARIARWSADARLVTLSGGLRASAVVDEGIRVELADGARTVERVVVCAGSESDLTGSPDPLWRALLSARRVEVDPHRLGIVTDRTGRALVKGAAQRGLYIVGPARSTQSFEAGSVPFITQQIDELVRQLASSAETDTHQTRETGRLPNDGRIVTGLGNLDTGGGGP